MARGEGADGPAGNATRQTAVLAALAAAGACLTLDELALRLPDLPRAALVAAAAGLIRAGHAVRRERGCYETPLDTEAALALRLTSGPKGPVGLRRKSRTGGLRARLWRAMRIKKKFALADLLTAATNGREKDAAGNAGHYLRALAAAGHVVELRRAKGPHAPPTSNGVKRYALVRDTGPAAPVVRPDGLYDPNTDTLHPRRETTA